MDESDVEGTDALAGLDDVDEVGEEDILLHTAKRASLGLGDIESDSAADDDLDDEDEGDISEDDGFHAPFAQSSSWASRALHTGAVATQTSQGSTQGMRDDDRSSGGGDADGTFFDLLQSFAQMHVPQAHGQDAPPEPCPICSQSFALDDFAAHVYKCIHALDDVEKKHQEDLDAKLARRIATDDARHAQFFGDSGRSTGFLNPLGGAGTPISARRSGVEDDNMDESGGSGHAESHTESAMNDEQAGAVEYAASFNGVTQPVFKKPVRKQCLAGKDCKEVSSRHFIQFLHPHLPCPICAEPFEVYEINAHVTLCLENPGGMTKSQLSSSPLPSTPSSSYSASNSSPSPFGPPKGANVFRGDIRRRTSNESDGGEDDVKSHDGIEDLDNDIDLSVENDNGVNSLTSGKKELTIQQLGAMAKYVMDQKAKPVGQQESSIHSLLDTFKTLGFTKESLQAASKMLPRPVSSPSSENCSNDRICGTMSTENIVTGSSALPSSVTPSSSSSSSASGSETTNSPSPI